VIETVLGPVDAGALGAVSMHEHVLADCTALRRDGLEPIPADPRVCVENLGFIRWNALALPDNLRLDDVEVAVAELALAVAAGQATVVDSTSWGLGPRHRDLPAISRASGAMIVSGYGGYLERTLPSWLLTMTEAELEAHLLSALTDRIPGTDFRAGMLGILGTTAELTEFEVRLLRASARAAHQAGCAVGIRLDPAARRGLDVLDICDRAGLPATSIVFGNVDEFLDEPYLADLAGAGAVLEMCFGDESRHHAGFGNVSDGQRIDFLSGFVTRHPAARWVLGCSVWTKAQLRRYGGMGYEHLMRRVVPALEARGVTDRQLAAMLRTTPVELLDRARPIRTDA
jgi:phosphotriesterase-related protein